MCYVGHLASKGKIAEPHLWAAAWNSTLSHAMSYKFQTWMNERCKNSTSLLNLTPISSSRFRLYLDSLDASTSTPQEKQQITKFFHDFMIFSVLFHGIDRNPWPMGPSQVYRGAVEFRRAEVLSMERLEPLPPSCRRRRRPWRADGPRALDRWVRWRCQDAKLGEVGSWELEMVWVKPLVLHNVQWSHKGILHHRNPCRSHAS